MVSFVLRIKKGHIASPSWCSGKFSTYQLVHVSVGEGGPNPGYYTLRTWAPLLLPRDPGELRVVGEGQRELSSTDGSGGVPDVTEGAFEFSSQFWPWQPVFL